jgi:hypothetical protein
MDASLSPILANFYLKTFKEKPKSLSIFVDDTLLIWNESKCANFDEYFKKFNNLRPNHIKFKVELEMNGSLPFLHLIVTRNQSKITFGVYRKQQISIGF